MPRYSREDLDRYYDYGIFAPKRLIYIGSQEYVDEEESGTDHLMAEKATKGITYLDTVSDKPIVVIMNNIGGDYYHGMSIFDTIIACRCHVTIIAMGYCCSMGSIILQAADLRVISPNCIFMIHDGTDTLSGHTKNVEVWAQESTRIRYVMYEIYKNKMKSKTSTITIKQIEKLCTIDKIFSPQETIEAGLADELLTQNINTYIKE